MDVRASPAPQYHLHQQHLHDSSLAPHHTSLTLAPQLIRQDNRCGRFATYPHHHDPLSQEEHRLAHSHPYPHCRVYARSSHYGFDDFWALAEEEEERLLILDAKWEDHLTTNLFALAFTSHPSPHRQSHDSLSSTTAAATTTTTTTTRSRLLTDPPAFLENHDEMTTIAQRSASPPELTGSKSSKSSSYRSSTFSGFDGAIPADLAHFEDIGLDDDHPRVSQELFGNRLNKKTSVRNLGGAAVAGRNHSPALPPTRELVNGAGRTSMSTAGGPRLDTASSPSMSSLGLPGGMRRVSSQTISSAAVRSKSRSRSRSRSPSPAHLMQGPVTPSSVTANSPGLRSMASFDRRRLSSGPAPQRPRKTAKEIEKEYNDSDEDLPDDASLWNVPMSPQMYRTASSAATSVAPSLNPSASTSPERPSHTGTPKSSKRSSGTPVMAPRTAPAVASEFSPVFDAAPPSPQPSRLVRGNTTGTMPSTHAFGPSRTKSWNNALSELSEEAKALSEALDLHAEETEQKNDPSATGNTMPDAVPKPQRSKTSMVNVLPLRTNNVMIDPLPISKEKEKVLSRTRPSWLPPKNPKEEKKHLKEYQRMMEQSLEAEKRRVAKEASAKCARDDITATLERLWNDHVIPHWDDSIREPRTREMWWRGIPASVRPAVWKRAISNELGLAPSTFDKALARAKAVEGSVTVPSAHSTDVSKEVHWLQAIRRDVKTTLPTLDLFQPGQQLHTSLLNILSAYAFYRSDVGYVYGSHLPAALLVLTLRDEASAFTALANLLNRPVPLSFLTGDPSGTQRTYELVLRLLSQKRPKLHRHLFGPVSEGGLGLTSEEILEPLLRTLFLTGSCTVVPTEAGPQRSQPGPSSRRSSTATKTAGIPIALALRLWDIVVFDGDGAIIRVCMGLVAAKEMSLYGSRDEVLSILGWGGDLDLGPEAEGEDGLERIITIIRDVGKDDSKAKKTKGSSK